ncbi:uncharacterized protein LOC134527137 [Bacillus rossius redtenbacheri]|uniref:uncharacterized protein LOC134527137 n=1 Tax=Bacillus rossius redtenbacheri TaxID=93214 RepID=UPI002FDD6D86
MPVLHGKIAWQWSERSLRRILHGMGFVWKKCQKKRSLLIERSDIVMWRSKYLTEMRQLRKEGHKIFYFDESWIDTNLTMNKCWQKTDSVKGILTPGNASNRLIIVHIGSANGFLDNALLVFKAGAASGDYHGQMNAENFEKWLVEKVIPNLPPASVIVMDNAPYHSKQQDKCPSNYATKNDIIEWLNRKGITCDSSIRKVTLLDLLAQHRPKEKIFRVDKLLKQHGHKVLRLPPYMCDLNAIERTWAKIKQHVRERNVSGELSLQALLKLTTDGVENVSKDDWEGYVRHVEEIEDYYWKKDCVMEIALDEFVIHLGEESTDDDLSIEASDSDDCCSAGSPLAKPL